MIINKVKFYNFKSYYKDVEFDLSIKKNRRNITIIYADNDVGKTNFFEGIQFGFYGTEWGQKRIELINKNSIEEKDYDCFVYIKGIHNNKNIEIIRKIYARNKNLKNIDERDLIEEFEIVENGKVLQLSDDEKMDYVNSIIHKNASKYFFFDGEKINAFNIASESDYKQAITRILGLKEIENSIEDLDIIVKEYDKELDKVLKKKDHLRDKIEQKERLQNEINDLNKLINDLEREKKEIKTRIIKIEDELQKYEPLKDKVEEKKKLQELLENNTKQLFDTKDNLAQIIKEDAPKILGIKIYQQDKRVKSILGDSIEYMDDKVVQYLEILIKNKKCICDKDLDEEDIEKIKAKIENYLNNNQEVKRKKEIQDTIKKLEKYLNYAFKRENIFRNLTDKLLDLEVEKSNLKREINNLEKELRNYSTEVNEDLASELKDCKNKLTNCQTKIDINKGKLEEKEKLVNELEKFIKNDKELSKEEKKLRNKYELSKSLYNIFIQYLDRLTLLKKQEVEKNASYIFLKLTNNPIKYAGLKITEDYKLRIKLSSGEIYELNKNSGLNPSTGQSKIISLAYIAAINKSSDAVAPVIIDNPVGLFSKDHRKKVVEYMPYFGEQVICMANDEDLSDNYLNTIKDYISRIYILEDLNKNSKEGTWNKTKVAEVKEIE